MECEKLTHDKNAKFLQTLRLTLLCDTRLMHNIIETNTRKHAHKCKNPNLKHNKNTKQPPISVV